MVINISGEGSRLGLHTNASETETQYFSKPDQIVWLSSNNVAEKHVDNFVYLEGEMTSSNTPSEDVVRRIGLATGVVGPFQTVWRSSDIATETIIATLQLACSVSPKTPKHGASREKTSCESLRWQCYATRSGTR